MRGFEDVARESGRALRRAADDLRARPKELIERQRTRSRRAIGFTTLTVLAFALIGFWVADQRGQDTVSPPQTAPSTVPEAETSSWLRWKVEDVGIVGTNPGNLAFVSVVDGGSVFVAGGNTEAVTAIDQMTGTRLWQTEVDGGVVGLLHAGADAVVVRGYGLLVGLDPQTGDELWRQELQASEFELPSDGDSPGCDQTAASGCRATWVWPLAAHRHGVMLFVLLDRPSEMDSAAPSILAIDVKDGNRVWIAEAADSERELDLQPGTSSSLILADSLLVKTTGTLHSFDLESGSVNWRYEFEVPDSEKLTSSPILASGDVIYSGDPNGEMVALSAETGHALWRIDVAEGYVAPVAVTRGLLLFVDSAGSHAVSADSGEPVWDQPGGDARANTFEESLIVFESGGVRRFDSATGDELWTKPINSVLPISVLVHDDRILLVGEDRLVVVEADTASVVGEITEGIADVPVIDAGHLIVAHGDGSLASYTLEP